MHTSQIITILTDAHRDMRIVSKISDEMFCHCPWHTQCTYPYVVSHPVSLLLVEGQVLSAFSLRAWLVLLCQLHCMVPDTYPVLKGYSIDHVMLILWPVLYSHSCWPCFSGVASFSETVEALANVNQVRIYCKACLFYLLLTGLIFWGLFIAVLCFLQSYRAALMSHTFICVQVLSRTTAHVKMFCESRGSCVQSDIF